MLNPDSSDKPLCSDSEVAEIPYVLRVSTPDVLGHKRAVSSSGAGISTNMILIKYIEINNSLATWIYGI